MNATPLFDTFFALVTIGLAISIATLVAVLCISVWDERRGPLPRATARSRPS